MACRGMAPNHAPLPNHVPPSRHAAGGPRQKRRRPERNGPCLVQLAAPATFWRAAAPRVAAARSSPRAALPRAAPGGRAILRAQGLATPAPGGFGAGGFASGRPVQAGALLGRVLLWRF